MDFNGLLSADFDFFKKKEKMLRDEYEKGRNDVKLHFRGLCYEMQKIHHKKTGGVLTIDKDFQNFNKKSNNISADHIDENNFKITVILNSDCLKIETDLISSNEDDARNLLDILKSKRTIIWELIMSSKFAMIYVEVLGKDKKNNYIKLSSFDVNTKNYDNFTGFIENNVSKGKTAFKLGIGYMFPKSECLKQAKNIAAVSYNSMNNLKDYLKKIV